MSKVFLIDLTMQWGMLKKHYDRNIGPLYHAFTHSAYKNNFFTSILSYIAYRLVSELTLHSCGHVLSHSRYQH
jgi:hypothetical protein